MDWYMPFAEIVSIAEKIETNTKIRVRQQLLQKQNEFTQWSLRKPIQFQKSEHKLHPNMATAKQNGVPHSGAKNSITFIHFYNAKKHKPKYKIFGQQNPDREQLANEGKYFLFKKASHMARHCATRKFTSNYQKVNKSMYNIPTASLSVESDVDTSHPQVIKPPTDN